MLEKPKRGEHIAGVSEPTHEDRLADSSDSHKPDMDGIATKYSTANPQWYFGYGSNLKSSVMQSRKIEPLAVRSVKVPGYILTFDVFGLPYSEPAMASISKYNVEGASRQDTIPDVHGVAYLLSAADMRRLIHTEGGGVAYNCIMVDGYRLDSGSSALKMHTLVARYPRRPNAAPSVRYLVHLLTDRIVRIC